ncbi:MAG: 4-hydroxythreonine-4-phosphate dehydrogenase PdxA [Pseudomonadota bacterium]
MSHKPVAISQGDPSGIGPDIVLLAWQKQMDGSPLPDFFVVGDQAFLKNRAAKLGINIQMANYDGSSVLPDGVLPVMDVGESVTGNPGMPNTSDAKATISAIDKAVDLVYQGVASSVVTCPINKDVLYQAGFEHPGHTEYLGALATQHTGEEAAPVMMLAGPELRTVPVTIHIALHDVQAYLTKELIVKTVSTTANDLQSRFGVDAPRIAIAGLNPHAGENGSMGKEEIKVISPAIEELKARGIDIRGPLPADTMFHASARKSYDAAVCMYHDQALIPAKMLGFDDAVNVTLGLPFIRTSPDHGTAYDIAGSGKANPSSFIAALNMAAQMAANS